MKEKKGIDFGEILHYDWNKLPIFWRGRLAYEDSGHVLTYVKGYDGYYTCSQKAKGRCDILSEKNLRMKEYEKKFEKVLEPLVMEKRAIRKFSYGLERQKLDLQEKLEDILEDKIYVIDCTIDVMKQDFKRDGKLKTDDIKTLIDIYKKVLKTSFPRYFMDQVISGILIFASLDRNLAVTVGAGMAERIYIDDNGKMLKMKLNGMGDYVFRLIESLNPDFMKGFKISIIDRIDFPSLKMEKVIEFFREDSYRTVDNFDIYCSGYSEKKKFDGLYGDLLKAKPEEVYRFAEWIKHFIPYSPFSHFNNVWKF